MQVGPLEVWRQESRFHRLTSAGRLRLQQLEGNQAHLAMDVRSMQGMGEHDGKAVRYILVSAINVVLCVVKSLSRPGRA